MVEGGEGKIQIRVSRRPRGTITRKAHADDKRVRTSLVISQKDRHAGKNLFVSAIGRTILPLTRWPTRVGGGKKVKTHLMVTERFYWNH